MGLRWLGVGLVGGWFLSACGVGDDGGDDGAGTTGATSSASGTGLMTVDSGGANPCIGDCEDAMCCSWNDPDIDPMLGTFMCVGGEWVQAGCPEAPPTAGTPCPRCVPVCDYAAACFDAPAVHAECTDAGTWTVTETPCPECIGDEADPCTPEQTCLATDAGGTCVADPCGGEAPNCGCAASLCEGVGPGCTCVTATAFAVTCSCS